MKYKTLIILTFIVQNLNSQNYDTIITYWKNTYLIKEKTIKSNFFTLPINKFYFNKKQEIIKMDTLMDDSLICVYEYKNGKVKSLSVKDLKNNSIDFCLYDSNGHYRYISSYKNNILLEEISYKFMFNSMEYKTLSHYKRYDNKSTITYTNYGYLLTDYNFRNFNITFLFFGNKTTYIRKSSINYRKLKRYKLTIEDVFKDLNKFFPNTVFVLFDDTKNKKGPLPDE